LFPRLSVRRALCLVLAASVLPLRVSGFEPAAVRAVARPSERSAVVRRRVDTAGTGTTLLSDPFTESASAANTWLAIGGACLTAGTSSTPSTSIPACGANAPQDAAGSGALQFTSGKQYQSGMIVGNAPLSTANGLNITFSYAAFNGTQPGADGITSFLTDASKAQPTAIGAPGGSLGYAGAPGVANGYIGVGFDSYGNYSAGGTGQTGGPGQTPDSIAVRGAASHTYPYLGGYESGGNAASLPFSIDTPTATTRPASPPTINETLTAAGVLTVSVDTHNGNGFVTYFSQSIVGTAGQPAVPASVYLGFTGSTGGSYEAHQVTGLTVTTIATAATPSPSPSPTSKAPATTLLSDPFTESASTANTWLAIAGACLTAGTSSTPSTSIPACGANAPQDAAGSGALQLTPGQRSESGMIVSDAPLSTANGLNITFSYAAFNGTQPGADGITSFLTDASKAQPTAIGASGGSLGYAGAPGVANGYIGIGFDSYGNYSGGDTGQTGGPGQTPDSIAVRGAASLTYPYLGGYESSGKAASLPFSIDAPTATTRPASPPTINETLTAAGVLTVSVDTHNGSGFVTYFSGSIVGTASEPAVPAKVYLGFTGSTGGSYEVHQIIGLTVTTIATTVMPSPSPSPIPSASPAPTASPVSATTPAGPGDAFSEPSTPPNAWLHSGSACLTAGTTGTPGSSIPACGQNAPVDTSGQGALQLTAAVAGSSAAAAGAAVRRRLATAGTTTTLLSDPFTESASAANTWLAIASACLTAGTSSTPSTSIPACGANAPQDAAGSGALQFTSGKQYQSGMIVGNAPLSTANGLNITFSYAAFNGTQPGADGVTSFLTDASKAQPTAIGAPGGSLGYAGAPGVANGYIGIGLDSYGNYSVGGTGQTGGPGQTPDSIAVRGAASLTYPYLGGYESGGNAASLPFSIDTPTATTRPASPPTINETLTAAGVLTVSVDTHNGNGFVTYFSESIVGTASEPAVPAKVYLGFTASTGGSYEVHQITGLTVTTITTTVTPSPSPSPSPKPSASPAPTASPAPSQSPLASANSGMVVSETPFSTSKGVHVTFSDDAFGGTKPGGDGVVLFFTDASQALPAAAGAGGGALGYGSGAGVAGIAHAYLGIGFDEAGGFSSTASGSGGPGTVPETIAIRGSASTSYAYLGGYDNSAGTAASLPFALDDAGAAARPQNPPTMDVVLSPAGHLIVSIDRHDGNGFVPYYSQTIAGLNGQPAVPANVYVGLSATAGSTTYETHQVFGFSIAADPSSVPGTAFLPSGIANLQAWYDASSPANVTSSGGVVSAWSDRSGNGNTLVQPAASAQPSFVASGINGLGSLAFASAAYLTSSNAAFSTSLFNASTVFFVTNQSVTSQNSSVGSAGAVNASPTWALRLSNGGGASQFYFSNASAGLLAPADVPSGPAIWTAEGSEAAAVQQLRKDGNNLSVSTGPGATVTGNYPFVVGANVASGAASYLYNGQIGEILVYNRLLLPSESASVEGYLACKWGLQNRLPANHPYHTACPGGGTSVSMPIPTPSPSALVDPLQIGSNNGQLVFNVIASQNSSGAPQLTYNGSSVPPTLRLLPGDTLIVNLTNNLPVPPTGSNYLNDTNLHYHGLHVNPNSPADDSIDLLAMPGQSLHYQIQIPADHPTGLYWYHSHAHGEAERQNLSGMSGALIIDGISTYASQVTNMPERILIVRDVEPSGTALPDADARQVKAMIWAMQHATATKRTKQLGMAKSHMTMNVSVRGNTNAKTRNPYVIVNRHFRRMATTQTTDTQCTGSAQAAVLNWTLNGQTVPSIGIRPGEQQFWRLVNAGSDTYLDIAVDNTTMQIVALDGVPLASVGSAPLTVTNYVVPPASRVEFIVTGPPAGTTSYLRTLCFDSGSAGSAMPAAVLAQISSTSSLTDNAKHRDRPLKRTLVRRAPHTVAYFRRYLQTAATTLRTQTLTYSDQNTINGLSYDPGAAPQFYAQSGTMEQWQIVNESSQVHTFHIHQVHFLVDQIVGGTAIEQSNVGQVLDNINVPAAGANGPGTVTLTMDFTDPLVIGTFLLHCHILSHEDAGMMSKIRIGTAPPLTNNAPNGITFATSASPAQTVTLSGGQTPYSVNGCSGVVNASVSGATITLTPVAPGQCVLTAADSSGLTTNISIAVTAPPPALGVSPSSVAFSSPGAASQNATISGGTPPYTVSGCTNIAAGSISSATLTVVPEGVGSCSLAIKDSASNTASLSVSVNSPASGGPLDNDTFHQNVARQGWYKNETQLTTANVASSSFKLLGSLSAPSGMPAFGKVYAQPLYAYAESIAGTSHNLVIISTSTDQVYAFDDATQKVVWERNFTNTSAGITQQMWTDTNCGDVNPNIGITSTPVIDRSSDKMYVVVPTKENGVFHIRLHEISLQNGTDSVSPVEVSASTTLATGGTATTDPEFNFSRTALLEANGNIYVGLGSHCDYAASTTHGWLLSFATGNLTPTGSVVDLTNANDGSSFFLGAVWMSGFGPAADSSGNVYFSTGNGAYNGTSSFAMTLLKLPGNLNIGAGAFFTPSNEASNSNNDTDFGSGGVMLPPDGISSKYPHLLVAGGKSGIKYVLNRDNPSGGTTGDAGALWSANVNGGMWGGPAFFQDASGNSYVVYGGGNPLSTFEISPSNATLSVVANSSNVGCLECRNSGSQPVISSNGTTAGTAIAWALKTPGNSGGTITLYAFDALKMTTLYSGAAGNWTVGSGASYIAGALVSPLVANGRVYVPTDGSVAVFGL
jgi:FtsP/CotA-like multicopper oxidase with cupredoxin domain